MPHVGLGSSDPGGVDDRVFYGPSEMVAALCDFCVLCVLYRFAVFGIFFSRGTGVFLALSPSVRQRGTVFCFPRFWTPKRTHLPAEKTSLPLRPARLAAPEEVTR